MKFKKQQLETKEKISLELEKLDFYKALSIGVMSDFSKNQPLVLTEPEKEKLIAILTRMFRAEKDYLSQNPEDYFELYEVLL